MTERDRVYAQILHFGLLSLRDAAALGQIEYCAVETDHLHNLPSLLGESNVARHAYYFEQERALYLDRVDRSVPGVAFLLQRYEELWQQLAALRDESFDGPEGEPTSLVRIEPRRHGEDEQESFSRESARISRINGLDQEEGREHHMPTAGPLASKSRGSSVGPQSRG